MSRKNVNLLAPLSKHYVTDQHWSVFVNGNDETGQAGLFARLDRPTSNLTRSSSMSWFLSVRSGFFLDVH